METFSGRLDVEPEIWSIKSVKALDCTAQYGWNTRVRFVSRHLSIDPESWRDPLLEVHR